MQYTALVALAAVAAAQSNSTGGSNTGSCPLQFTSSCSTSSQCGTLNGFKLECQTSGSVKWCVCAKADSNCQNSTNIPDTVPQFGVCTGGKTCAGSGFKALDVPVLTCAEQLYCVPQKTDGNELQSICHTCSSCKQQNKPDSTGKLIFNCSSICPAGQGDPVISVTNTTTATKSPSSKNKSAAGSAGGVNADTTKSSASKFIVGLASVLVVSIGLLV
uniref:Secreted protein n=1 Tax=Achlya hypogyna TaxID=1202772 RepID=A0A0A7CLT9_ACHHY|nr:secreted protein [Achlya hypogyna]